MLKALLALLALLVQAFVPTPHGEVEASAAQAAQLAPHSLLLDATLLPAPTGWFLVPITADRPTEVRVDAWAQAQGSAEGLSVYHVLLRFPGDTASPFLGGDAFSTRETAGVHALGVGAATCCPDAAALAPREVRASRTGILAPGETLWVGLVAADWVNESRLEVRIDALDGKLTAGDALTGTGVRAVDLVREAAGGGNNVVLDGRLVAGNMSRANVTFTPESNALVAVSYHAEGDAGADLWVSLGDGSMAAHPPLKNVAGFLVHIQPGPVRVELAHARLPKADDDTSRLHVIALLADIEWPAPTAWSHHRSLAEADEAPAHSNIMTAIR